MMHGVRQCLCLAVVAVGLAAGATAVADVVFLPREPVNIPAGPTYNGPYSQVEADCEGRRLYDPCFIGGGNPFDGQGRGYCARGRLGQAGEIAMYCKPAWPSEFTRRVTPAFDVEAYARCLETCPPSPDGQACMPTAAHVLRSDAGCEALKAAANDQSCLGRRPGDACRMPAKWWMVLRPMNDDLKGRCRPVMTRYDLPFSIPTRSALGMAESADDVLEHLPDPRDVERNPRHYREELLCGAESPRKYRFKPTGAPKRSRARFK